VCQGETLRVVLLVGPVAAGRPHRGEVKPRPPVLDPEDESDGKAWFDHLNPASRHSVRARLEPALRDATPEQHFQFERIGYFVADRADHAPAHPVFNRAVTLRDSWSKPAPRAP
jgi:hypothetical protein